MNKMPDYTIEQKAAAFDKLWEQCGNGAGELITYKTVIKSVGRNNSIAERVPVFEFKLRYNGNVYKFKDILHNLACPST